MYRDVFRLVLFGLKCWSQYITIYCGGRVFFSQTPLSIIEGAGWVNPQSLLRIPMVMHYEKPAILAKRFALAHQLPFVW